jgi:hypothetical protein
MIEISLLGTHESSPESLSSFPPRALSFRVGPEAFLVFFPCSAVNDLDPVEFFFHTWVGPVRAQGDRFLPRLPHFE